SMEVWASVPPCDGSEIEFWIGCPHMCLGQTKLAAHNIGAFHHRDALIVCDSPAESFAAKAAIGGDHQPLGRNEFQCTTDQPGNIFRRLHDRIAVIDHADADLPVGLVFAKQSEIASVAAGTF